MARVCVIGAGPSGCVLAARLAQLGHEVTIVERRAFPRTALGESLTPGVLQLLGMIGARDIVDAAGFTHVRSVTTTWDGALTQRDLTLLRLLAAGYNNRQIANELALAESTVKNNLSALFQKIGVRDRTQAVLYAFGEGLVPRPMSHTA